jgi:hypothetical protein
LNNFEKNYRAASKACAAALNDPHEVIGEFLLFDDEKVISIRLESVQP